MEPRSQDYIYVGYPSFAYVQQDAMTHLPITPPSTPTNHNHEATWWKKACVIPALRRENATLSEIREEEISAEDGEGVDETCDSGCGQQKENGHVCPRIERGREQGRVSSGSDDVTGAGCVVESDCFVPCVSADKQ